MEDLNFYIVLATGIVPLILGAIWYSPALFAKSWMKESGLSEDQLKGGNMVVIFGLTLLFGMFLAMALMPIVIHQIGFFSTLQGLDITKPDSEEYKIVQTFTSNYGSNFRTFKHGAFHGTLTGFFFVLPLMAVNGLFERKSWKYIFINTGFWTLCCIIMGGIISAFA